MSNYYIYIREHDGFSSNTSYQLSVSEDDTIENVKSQMITKLGLQTIQDRVWLQEPGSLQAMVGHKTLKNYNITKEATINIRISHDFGQCQECNHSLFTLASHCQIL